MAAHQYKVRHYCLMAMLALATGLAAALAQGQDISRLSDFAGGSFTSNESWISQNGDSNQAAIDQGPSSAFMADRQYADVTQNGYGNQASVTQNGDMNRVRINQNGFDTASTSQTGSGNMIDLIQNGGSNQFSATQTGNDNSIVFTQNGANQASVTETGNSNSVHYNQAQGGMSVNIALKGDNMSVKVN